MMQVVTYFNLDNYLDLYGDKIFAKGYSIPCQLAIDEDGHYFVKINRFVYGIDTSRSSFGMYASSSKSGRVISTRELEVSINEIKYVFTLYHVYKSGWFRKSKRYVAVVDVIGGRSKNVVYLFYDAYSDTLNVVGDSNG